MPELSQNDRERLVDQMLQGKITAEQANVLKVLWQRVELCTRRMPRDVRNALNAAVKRGEIKHMRKDGLRPEAYYHPDFEGMAIAERNKYAHDYIDALKRAYRSTISGPELGDSTA